MGLKGDVDEVVTMWHKASWPVKAWLLLSGFIAVSAIASLSDEIARWKGFFKDAIDFYRGWITAPLQTHVLAPLGVHLPSVSMDGLVFWLLAYSVMLRAIVVIVKKDLYLVYFCFAIGIAGFVAWTFISNNNRPNDKPYAWLDALLFFWILYLPLTFLSWPELRPYRKELERAYVGQLAIVFLVVGVMAAINAGLSR